MGEKGNLATDNPLAALDALPLDVLQGSSGDDERLDGHVRRCLAARHLTGPIARPLTLIPDLRADLAPLLPSVSDAWYTGTVGAPSATLLKELRVTPTRLVLLSTRVAALAVAGCSSAATAPSTAATPGASVAAAATPSVAPSPTS